MLDNCEHLLDGCAVLASTLVTSCPGLRVLATSGQPLGAAGEVRMVVPPMSLPEAGAEVSVERVLACDAVWLLSERAAAVVPGFAVDAGTAATVAELCRRLDGVPLALELAAVRLGSLSLDQLNQGLAEELSILGRGNRGAVLVRTDRRDPHHQHPQQAGPQLQDPDQPLDRRPERAGADHAGKRP